MRNHSFALIGGLLLAVFYTRIFAIDPTAQLIGDFGDKYEFFAFQQIVKENILAGKYPLERTDVMRYPVGFEFSHGYDGAFATFTGALLSFILPGILAYNATVLIILTLNMVSAYILCRYISRSSLMGAIGAVMYGVSPYVIARMNGGHLNLLFIAGFPLFVYSTIRLYKILKQVQDDKKKILFWDIFLVFTTFLLIPLGSLQYIIMLFWTGLFFTIGTVVFLPIRTMQIIHTMFFCILPTVVGRHLKEVSISLLLFTAAGLLFFGGFLIGMVRGTFAYPFDFTGFTRCCQVRLPDLFIPNQYMGKMWTQWNHSPSSIERIVTLGLVEWMIVGMLFWIEKGKAQRIVFFLSVTVFIIFSLGYFHIPYWPEGGRSVVLLSLVPIILLARCFRRERRRTYVVLLFLLVFERMFFTVHTTPPLPLHDGEIVRELPGSAMLVLPISKYNSRHSAFPFIFGKKIVDGYFHDTAENRDASSFLTNEFIQKFICDGERDAKTERVYIPRDRETSRALFRSYDIRTILVPKTNYLEKFNYDECENVRYWWYQLSPESLALRNSTQGIEKKTFELVRYPKMKASIFFKRGGTFQLHGVLIYPPTLKDTFLLTSRGERLYPLWQESDSGLKATFTDVMAGMVASGDEVWIISETPVRETAYVTIYYEYAADESASVVYSPIENVYNGDEFDVFIIR